MLSLMELKFVQRSMQVFHRSVGHLRQVELISLVTSHLYIREVFDFLRLASRLANLFGHPSQVRTQVLVLR